MPEEQVGVVVKFFSKPSVAAIEVTSGPSKPGTPSSTKATRPSLPMSWEAFRWTTRPIEEAQVGNMVGVKVKERVREGDKVYKVVE